MAKFVLMFNKQVIKEYPFQKESITIGRKPENDITIDNLAVSGYHARVDKTGSEYILTDLQSTNGTFVNDKKIVSHKLSHGDNIIIGKHTLLFLAPEINEKASASQDATLDLNKTMMLDTARQRELLSKQQVLAPTPKKPKKIGVLSFLDGSKLGEVELRKKLTRIGKASTSEVRLSGLFMGATAATISRRPSGYTITFTGGMTKLKVNGEVVKGSLPLKDFDTIELGSYKFQFYQKEVE
ncbi:MAG: FHA domain-containing protein [Deltaproteobacteria bacterium]|nr:FHA domain-containing protein [Deltaproteobacteria bacterium]MBW1928728.1 FHA domain-containing protein [Deltaproteobacteria bacterium]MBW2024473.1 FHA domain-containing protein [Deltaproteobacteria bacterium]MBW2124100.1 FHA domain-containing protein [Deltaproteobacteria bacterium]RLB13585.1 MAG: FHA domain-containing protein [Deltaproteobacteria bacterium]